MLHRFVLPVSRGLEGLLAQELVSLGLGPATPGHGIVEIAGPLSAGYRACIGSRIASRVLLQLARFPGADADALYRGAARIPWESHIDPAGTLWVDVVGGTESLRHRQYAARVTKDAVVDRLRTWTGERPSVEREAPDLRLVVHLGDDGHINLLLDLAGDPLHERGAGRAAGDAPIKETLAAALLFAAGWPAAAARGTPLVDPFCGAGTILREAAAMARDQAPGLGRRRWGFSRWRGHDAAAWAAVRAAAQAAADAGRGRPLHLSGSDEDAAVLARAAENLLADGVDDVRLTRRAVDALVPPRGADGPGLLVTNPPYGERLGSPEAAAALHRTFGDRLKLTFDGWTAWVVTAVDRVGDLGLRPARRMPAWNGPLEVRFVEIPIRGRNPRVSPAAGSEG
jgi:23S rRNA (guanine2445-N2)-methyltransferase / 23S rRNA (guanine2069-N7)-methyltransferase